MYRLLKKLHISPYLAVALSFFLVILLGSFILWTPWAYQNREMPQFIDAFFTAASAVCVTGLNVYSSLVDTFSVFGKVVIALLIQLGGLGFITIFAFTITLFGRRISVLDRYLLKRAFSVGQNANILRFIRQMAIISLIIEAIGSIPFMIVFIPQYGFWTGVGKSIFQAISSFNNAGFDLIGDSSLMPYYGNYIVTLNTIMLVFLGGIGFLVIGDILKTKRIRNWSIITKISLLMSFILTFGGALLVFLLDEGGISFYHALFQSVVARTAGFYTVQISGLTTGARGILLLLMFIGASPLSTGGGTKTSTWFVILITGWSFIRGKKAQAFKRSFSQKNFIQATTLVFFAFMAIMIGVLVVNRLEQNNPSNDIYATYGLSAVVFECFSAFGTVGTSFGITPYLSTGSKIVLCTLMFFGRVGPMTLISSVSESMNREEKLHYANIEADVIVG